MGTRTIPTLYEHLHVLGHLWELCLETSQAVRLISFVSHILGITILFCLSHVMKTVVSYILSVPLVISGGKVNPVPLSSSWLLVEGAVLLFYYLLFKFLFWYIYLYFFLIKFYYNGEMLFCYLELFFSRLVLYLVLTFLLSFFFPEQCLHGCHADYFNLVYA